MGQLQKTGHGFYESLGKLFYFIAMADKRIRVEELEMLKDFIRKFWLEVDLLESKYGKEAAFQIETTFVLLWKQDHDPALGFDDFKSYYRNHKEEFDTYVKVLILDTANAIAGAFSGKSKGELIALAKLQLLFQ